MKIAYIIENFSIKGGAERIVASKADALASIYGHEVTVVSVYHDDRPAAYALSRAKLQCLGVPPARRSRNAAARTLSRTRTLALAARRMNKAMDELRPDVIFFTLSLGALLLPLYRGKAARVYESHSARRFTPYHSLFFPTERMADAVVCLTKGDAGEFRHARNVKVIPDFLESVPVNAVDYSVKRAVAVGRLEHAKGFDILIRCWKKAVEQCPGWTLDIWGEGSLREELKRQITDEGANGAITLRGRTENMAEKYHEYSLAVATSRYEGFSMALLEAQAAGLPAVATDFTHGARSIITDGMTGLIVAQGDEEMLVKALGKTMSDEKLRRFYGEEARRQARRFSFKETMEKWDALIKDVCTT